MPAIGVSAAWSATDWSTPRAPFRIYANSYYVGTAEVAAALITSPDGHVLIDGVTAKAAPQIAANIRTLGFRVEDVKLILNSHVHSDHAGGLAELQRLSGAAVKASPGSQPVLTTGQLRRDDPQAAIADSGNIAPVAKVSSLRDGEVLRLGPIAVAAVFTPGHTPGGTSWTWQACEAGRCLQLVYADSLNAVSGPDYRFSDNPAYLAGFNGSIGRIRDLPCDILLSIHPEFSDFWKRLEQRDAGHADALVDRDACRRYADAARRSLDRRLAEEAAK
jgi:metallo-beta-lactamase class B